MMERIKGKALSRPLGVEVHSMHTNALFRNLGDLVCFQRSRTVSNKLEKSKGEMNEQMRSQNNP